jgi:rubrerythrin
MILSEHGIKHAEAIIKHCTDNGMAVEATMGLWNHLVRILLRLDVCEGRAARQLESAPTAHNSESTPFKYPCRVCGSKFTKQVTVDECESCGCLK